MNKLFECEFDFGSPILSYNMNNITMKQNTCADCGCETKDEYEWLCYDCGFKAELDMCPYAASDCNKMVKVLYKNPKYKQCKGMTFLLVKEEFILRAQVSNGIRMCAYCDQLHDMLIVQRMYARHPRKGIATEIMNKLVDLCGGVWIQSTITDESRAFCKAIGCKQDKYCKDQWYICNK